MWYGSSAPHSAFCTPYKILPDRLMVGLLPLEQCILVRIQVWQQMNYFFENIFSGTATLLSVLAILFVYYFEQKSEKRKAARILIMEIRNAEKVISEIKTTKTVTQASFLLPVNSWPILQHHFVKHLDNDELILMNEFYNLCRLTQEEIDRMKSYLYISSDEKIKLSQHKLLELAERHKQIDIGMGENPLYKKDKESILENVFYKETSWFQPHISTERIIDYLQNIRFVSTSSCGKKIKDLSGL